MSLFVLSYHYYFSRIITPFYHILYSFLSTVIPFLHNYHPHTIPHHITLTPLFTIPQTGAPKFHAYFAFVTCLAWMGLLSFYMVKGSCVSKLLWEFSSLLSLPFLLSNTLPLIQFPLLSFPLPLITYTTTLRLPLPTIDC